MYKKNEAAHVHNGFLQALTQSSHLSQKNSAMPDMVSKTFTSTGYKDFILSCYVTVNIPLIL